MHLDIPYDEPLDNSIIGEAILRSPTSVEDFSLFSGDCLELSCGLSLAHFASLRSLLLEAIDNPQVLVDTASTTLEELNLTDIEDMSLVDLTRFPVLHTVKVTYLETQTDALPLLGSHLTSLSLCVSLSNFDFLETLTHLIRLEVPNGIWAHLDMISSSDLTTLYIFKLSRFDPTCEQFARLGDLSSLEFLRSIDFEAKYISAECFATTLSRLPKLQECHLSYSVINKFKESMTAASLPMWAFVQDGKSQTYQAM